MADQFRYFRIEARELIDGLSSALAELSGTSAEPGHTLAELSGTSAEPGQGLVQVSTQVALLLRHAHTLKGAARVVSATAIADLTHSLEELLDPYRHAEDVVPPGPMAQMRELTDRLSSELAALDKPEAVAVQAIPLARTDPGTPSPSPAPTPAPALPVPPVATTATAATAATAATELHAPGDLPDEPLDETARVWVSEIDDVISGLGGVLAQVRVLSACTAQLTDLRAGLAEPPGLRPGDIPRKIARLQGRVDDIERTVSTCAERLDRELREVHDAAERLRLVPVDSIARDLELAARDVATEQGKRVRMDLSGGQIRLDAPVLAAVHVALRQIVRNAVAHGIEKPAQRLSAGKAPEGAVRVQVTQASGQLTFRCDDDGRGIDLLAVREQLTQQGVEDGETASQERVLELLMRGGVSTAPVLSEVSGRGIGLDVIRDAAHRLGGQLRISTRDGAGTTFELVANGSLTAQQVLLVDAGTTVALPLSAVRTTLRVESASISRGVGGETLIHDGRSLPFLPLAALLGEAESNSTDRPAWNVLIVESSYGTAALGVNRLLDAAEIAIRPLPALAPVSPVVTGAWLNLDGHPRLVLDPGQVVAAAGRRRALDLSEPSLLAPILVVDDSLTTRMLEQSILQAAGYEVELAASAEEGLRMASSRPYSLVLVDVEMPGMDGFAFIEQTRARAELRHLPCILVTTRSSAVDRQRGIDAGARGHIDKGEFHQGALLSRIAELLAG